MHVHMHAHICVCMYVHTSILLCVSHCVYSSEDINQFQFLFTFCLRQDLSMAWSFVGIGWPVIFMDEIVSVSHLTSAGSTGLCCHTQPFRQVLKIRGLYLGSRFLNQVLHIPETSIFLIKTSPQAPKKSALSIFKVKLSRVKGKFEDQQWFLFLQQRVSSKFC